VLGRSRRFRAVFAFERAKGDSAAFAQVKIGDGLAIDESPIGRAAVVKPVMVFFENELGMKTGEGPVDDLDGIQRQATEGHS